jgi:alpha-beta hydrolase superfamily lysophospholipase
MNPESITKTIRFNADGFRLTGTLHLPGTRQPPVVIGCHGLLSNRQSPKQIALADTCTQNGMAYFRFDHRGCGDSQGEFEEVTSLEARCKDLFCAIQTIKSRGDTGDRIGLFGSSMGGTVCLSVAGQMKLSPIVTVAAPIRSRILKELPLEIDGVRVKPIFLDARQSHFDISAVLADVSNLLIFHGEADTVVPIDHARELYKMAGRPRKLIVQKQGDHPMSDKTHQKEFIQMTTEWFKSGLIDSSCWVL